jgi:hypothetical protein
LFSISHLDILNKEVESVRSFLDRKQLRAKHLERTAEDGVKLKDGRRIADPGFMAALEDREKLRKHLKSADLAPRDRPLSGPSVVC